MLKNIPNRLTLFRIGVIPVFVLVFYLPFRWTHLVTTTLFGLAALTDWLDGFLARRLGQTSAFGAFLDPVADKLMVAVALVLLVERDPSPWLAVTSCVIIGREITISALREWMAVIGERTRVTVITLSKFKTTAQMLAIALMLYGVPAKHSASYQVGFALLCLAALLTIWSMFVYLQAARSVVMGSVAPKVAPPRVDTSSAETKINSPAMRE